MVLDYINKNPGKRTEEIRTALGLAPDYAKKILAGLRDAQRVATKGEKRTTTYSVG